MARLRAMNFWILVALGALFAPAGQSLADTFVFDIGWASAPTSIPNGGTQNYRVRYQAVNTGGATNVRATIKEADWWPNPDDFLGYEIASIPAGPGIVGGTMTFALQCRGGKVHGTMPVIPIDGGASGFLTSGERTAEIFVVMGSRKTSKRSVRCR